VTLSKSQTGFSHIILPLLIVVLGAAGFTGWKVYEASKNPKSAQTSTVATTPPPPTPAQPSETIPEGFIEYRNEELGFKFAYPEEWGVLSEDSGQYENILHRTKTPQYVGQNLQGVVDVTAYDKENFTISSRKYGPTIKPIKKDSFFSWEVIESNPADETTKLGDKYEVKVAREIDETKVFNLFSGDEGCYTAQWVFETKDSWITIRLPAVCADNIDVIPQNRLDTYEQITDKILNTIQIDT
jgi:hypothetical protein